MGYHCPRSSSTVAESLHGLETFKEFYGEAECSDVNQFYTIAASGSKVGADKFVDFCEHVGLPLTEAWPPVEFLDRRRIEASWSVPEKTFDYAVLKTLVLRRLSSAAGLSLVRGCSPISCVIGAPHEVTLSDGRQIQADVLVNATYAGSNEVARALAMPEIDLQYELCMMPIMEVRNAVSPIGVTVMDGPFCSIMPEGKRSGRYIVSHVQHGICQSSTGRTLPDGVAINGTRETAIVEECRSFFPVVADMNLIDTMIAWKVVPPSRHRDDGRPSILYSYGDGLFSVLSGKVATCVDVARRIRDHLL